MMAAARQVPEGVALPLPLRRYGGAFVVLGFYRTQALPIRGTADMKGRPNMNAMVIARYAEIEAEAKRRGVDPDVLTTRLEQAIACRFGAVPTPGRTGRSRASTT